MGQDRSRVWAGLGKAGLILGALGGLGTWLGSCPVCARVGIKGKTCPIRPIRPSGFRAGAGDPVVRPVDNYRSSAGW